MRNKIIARLIALVLMIIAFSTYDIIGIGKYIFFSCIIGFTFVWLYISICEKGDNSKQ
jgi:hypothetical protein